MQSGIPITLFTAIIEGVSDNFKPTSENESINLTIEYTDDRGASSVPLSLRGAKDKGGDLFWAMAELGT